MRDLLKQVGALTFSSPVTHVYNPLRYARDRFAAYWERYGRPPKRILFVGMNPGPWGMVQTGVPFGDVEMV
ncbi:MAG: single-stranded DNA-binding protein, partial [Desulfosarcinaceae bacterium]